MAIQDTYFLNAQKALEVAQEQNKLDERRLQVCYYDGDKLDADLPNLIHLPLENFVNDLALGLHRLPEEINFDNSDLSPQEQNELTLMFMLALDEVRLLRQSLVEQAFDQLHEAKPNFNERLRVYIPASASTQVMQYVSKAVAEEFEKRGCDVFFNLDYGTQDSTLPTLAEFNPHIFFNINHLNSHIFGKNVFNFVWFQDAMPFITDPTPVTINPRDYIFSLLPMIDRLLQKKHIPYQRQSFCVNENIYKQYPEIQREKKVVFIGSSYARNIPHSKEIQDATEELIEIFLAGESFSDAIEEEIATKYKLNLHFVQTKLVPYIVRDFGVLELCKLSTDYTIEIYGHGWERYKQLTPFYKGMLTYGEDIARVYNGATFAFAPHQKSTLQQRIFEASACGAIPIVYDCRNISDEESYEEALCYYKTSADLEKILNADVPDKEFEKLLKNHTYGAFVDKMLAIVKENT